MATLRARNVAVAALVAALSSVTSACYVEEDVPPPGYAEGYTPPLYDGYVVYYDDVGRPFYYLNGAVVWVPPTSPFYIGLVHHWRVHGPAYHRWYAHYGYRYRGYHARHRW
ncbi:MAG TPA: hypothetical protein VKU41_30930 [Polyangiaceae bacterium]|nr:hypothetical protein [Polyangiaceae bacterium]